MAYPNFEKEIDETRRRVLDYLKPFQRETVLHVDRLFSRGIRRVLVADEVGLGKTLVARGVVATTAALRIAEGDDLFKVGYCPDSCANSSRRLPAVGMVTRPAATCPDTASIPTRCRPRT